MSKDEIEAELKRPCREVSNDDYPTRDEKAYNAFMRAYNEMMRGRGGLFDSVEDAKRGEDPYARKNNDWQYLEDLGISYNPRDW